MWIYKGDILPYKVSVDEKITREAAMAVGETSGQGRPRRLITAGGGRRRLDQPEPGSLVIEEEAPGANGATVPAEVEAEAPGPEEESVEAPVGDLIAPPPVPDELERRLAEDEEIERRSRHEHRETPHFRRED